MAQPVRPDLQQRLALMTGTLGWLVAFEHLVALEPWPQRLTPVPFCHAWLLGVAPWRGTVHSVLDLSRFVGHEPVTANSASRLLVLADHGSGHTAIVASAMRGLRSVAEMERVPDDQAQSLGAVQHPCVGRVWRDGDGQCWHELAVPQLMASAQWLKAERGPGPQ